MANIVDKLSHSRKESMPSEQAAGAANTGQQRRAERQQLLRHLGGMSSVDEFKQYCIQQRISLMEQKQIILDLFDCCCSYDYYSNLLLYAQQLDQMQRNRQALLSPFYQPNPTIPSSDLPTMAPTQVVKTTPPATVQPLFSDKQEAPLETFWLSSEGCQTDKDVRHNFVKNLFRLGFIDRDRIADMELLLGFGTKDGVLTRPIPFLGYKTQAAFLFAMLYGTLSYTLSSDTPVRPEYVARLGLATRSKKFSKGTYRCSQLITVPRGRGLNAVGTTRDPYWDLVARALSFPLSGKTSADPAHSFANALNACRSLSNDRAAPLLLLLQPLGLSRSDT